MASNRKYLKKNKEDVLIDAEFRIKAEKIIESFLTSSATEYCFPSNLTNVERAFVHNLAPKYNIITKSHGKNTDRKLTLYKLKENDDSMHKSTNISLCLSSVSEINSFFKEHPTSESKRDKKDRKIEVKSFIPFALLKDPTIPIKNDESNETINRIRKNLPIFEFKEKIIDAIDKNRIILVQGSTGSGKTTQIPQYILEMSSQRKQGCRILCTQPRRISAISSAERVCYERGVKMGTTVGYQIRLDSKVSANTNCIFLTPGVFLRYLMGKKVESIFTNITHIIIDEVHERNKENDFLLTSIKEHINVNPNLKLIIMSANLNTLVFSNYFESCEEISIFTKPFDVDEYYLEDILKLINFHETNLKARELTEKYKNGQAIQSTQSEYIRQQNESFTSELEVQELDEDSKAYLDELLENMSTNEDPESYFDQFLYLVQNEGTPVNYRHSQTQMTALMIAVGRSWTTMIKKLLSLNADPKLKVNFGGYEMSSVEIAEQICGEKQDEIINLLHYYKVSDKNQSLEDCYNKALINIYQDTILKTKSNNFIIDETVDHEIIAALAQKIHTNSPTDGAILIFLPGFDDILQMSNLLDEKLKSNTYSLFMLHSSMRTDDQKNVFRPTLYGKRKIVLSTNIAESSITVNDVVYVIDSGREKQKSFDAISHSSSLRVQWISKASANQRKGRAGRLRSGIVYRVYSRDRFRSMLDTTIPELLRTSLTEVCLQTKLLVDSSTKIEEFLQRCIASPSIANIRQSVKYLQRMGALDNNENLTTLGSVLVGMPVEAKYGKMLVYSIIFKCLNPILSLVSILTMGDQVFILPIKSSDRYNCEQWKKRVASSTFSDHFLMLSVFNHWMNLKKKNDDLAFCERNFISSYHLEQVRGIRNQILNYLQESGLVHEEMQSLNENSNKWPTLKAVICAGLYPFIAYINRKKGLMFTEIDRRLSFHMSSILNERKEGYKQVLGKLPVDWTVFEEKNRIQRMTMLKCNTLINSMTVYLMAGSNIKQVDVMDCNDLDDNGWEDLDEDAEEEEEEEEKVVNFTIDSFIKFSSSIDTGPLIFELRARIDDLIERFLNDNHFKHSSNDLALIKLTSKILNDQDVVSGLEQVNVNRTIAQDPSQQNYQERNSGNFQKQKRSNYGSSNSHYNSSNFSWRAAPSTSSQQFQSNTSYQYKPQNQFKQSRISQRFFVININSRKFSEISTKNVVRFDNYKSDLRHMYNEIIDAFMDKSQVFIIFFSSIFQQFLGYGEMSCISNNHPLMINLKASRKVDLNLLNNLKFSIGSFRKISSPTFFCIEISEIDGNTLIVYF